MQAFSSAFYVRAARLTSARQQLTQKSTRQLQQLFGKSLPRQPFRTDASKTRKRIFVRPIIFWAFLFQILHHFSCRGALQKIHLLWGKAGKPPFSSDTSGYCQARLRLPIQVLKRIFTHTAQVAEESTQAEHLWLGRRVRVVDCTNAKMPDTKENQAKYPQPSCQKPGCGFPLIKVMAVFSLATGVMLHYLTCPHTIHEAALFKLIWDFFQAGDVILGDRAFTSYAAIAQLKIRQVDVVFRLSSIRPVDFRRGQRLGKNDTLFRWIRPLQRTHNMTLHELHALPETLPVRILRFRVSQPGFRTQSVTLVTTLLDPIAYPAEELAQLFFQRWVIELRFRDIKVSLCMEMLSCKSPDMIEKEILMFFILHNLIRHLIWNSAEKYRIPITRLSFKGALDLLMNTAPLFASLKPNSRASRQIYNAMLRLIADDLVPHRPGRMEPRCIKRRPKPYQLLTKPRHLMREIPHRGKKIRNYAS